jgi:signal transduction histidine kinase
LSGGDYIFRVKASNSDGVWGPETLALKVQVAPPFWETWWFRGALTMVLAVIALGAYQMRMQKLQARRRELETQVAQRTHDLATLNAIARVVSHSLDLKEILRDAVERTLQVVGMEVGSALVLDEGTQDLILLAYHGLSDTPVQLGERWSLAAALSGKTLNGTYPLAWNVATDYPDGALKARLLREGIQLVVGVPLIAKEKMVGMLVLSTRTPRALTSEETFLLSAIGQQIGIAVENARLYEQAEQAAAITERSRLARELHDSVTQLLYSVTLYAEAAAQLLETGNITTASKHLCDLRDTAQEALREMRLLIFELRPLELEKMTLVAAIRARLDAVESRGGMKADLHIEGEERLPRAMQAELYHIVQETLNNTLKHSNAKQVSVSVRFTDVETCLDVTDDGVGFDLAEAHQSGGMDLRGMEERVEKIHGTLQIESVLGKGTRVIVRVPKPSQENGGTR